MWSVTDIFWQLVSLCTHNATVANKYWCIFSIMLWQIYVHIHECASVCIRGVCPFTVLTSYAYFFFFLPLYSHYPNAEVVNFGTWFLFSFPVSLIMLVLTWFWMHWLFLGCKWVQVVQDTWITKIGHLWLVKNMSHKDVSSCKWQKLRHNLLLLARTVTGGNLTA